ncbi:uncharacterized protein [Hyperolius riggenbachi]|uniref:uncharacterized protein n=1 Tax=Hyperolius riggenbachi TaxID=752182 RepID=UPI0035A306DF
MGRSNSNGSSSENSQPKSLPMKITLPKNNNCKKNQKSTTESNQDHQRIIQTKVVHNIISSKSKTSDFQNGNHHQFHSGQPDSHVPTRASPHLVSEQFSGVLKVSNIKGKTLTTSMTKSQKDAFQFWSAKVHGQEENIGRETAKASPKLKDNKNIIVKDTSSSFPMENGGGPEIDTASTSMKAFKRKKRDEIFSAGAFSHIDEHVLLAISNQSSNAFSGPRQALKALAYPSSSEIGYIQKNYPYKKLFIKLLKSP